MSDYNPTGKLVGEGVLSAELTLSQGVLHDELVGEGVLAGWLRQDDVPIYRGSFTDEADLPTIALVKNDWADITPVDGSHSYSVVWDGTSAWERVYTTKQGPIIGSPEHPDSAAYVDAMKPQVGHSTWPFRIWDGIDTTITHQPFQVDGSGNIRIAGTIEASAIDLPGTGQVGFHVNESGKVGVGGTTADDGLLTISPVDGSVLVESSTGSKVELYVDTVTDDAILDFYAPGTVSPGSLWAQDSLTLSLSSPRDVTNTVAASSYLVSGPSSSTTVAWLDAAFVELGKNDAGTTTQLSVQKGFITIAEAASAPSAAAANTLNVYAKDKGGVSALYVKNEAGTELELGTITLTVQEGDSTVDAAVTTLDFGVGFDVSSSPAGEANIALDLTEITLPTHGASIHTDVTRSVWIPAQMMSMADGATSATAGATDARTAVITLANLLTQTVYWDLVVPDDYTSGGEVVVYWIPNATRAGSESVRWSLRAAGRTEGTSITAAGTADPWTGDAEAHTQNLLYIETARSFSITTSAGALWRMNLRRIGGDAADTYEDNVHLVGVLINYTADQ